MTCRYNKHHNAKYVNELSEALKKIKNSTVNFEPFINNIKSYLNGESIKNGTQQLLGYGTIFRGIIVRDWVNGNEFETKYSAYNRIITAKSVTYYYNCRCRRNTRRHSEVVKRKIVREWFKNEITDSDNLRHPVISIYIERGATQIVNRSTNTIQKWLIALHTIRKKGTCNKTADIRSFFQPII